MMTDDAKTNRAIAAAPFKVEKVQSWRATLRRAVAWKTARYTKGDIEATVVGVTDEAGNTGYGYMPAMLIVGESPSWLARQAARGRAGARPRPGRVDRRTGDRPVAVVVGRADQRSSGAGWRAGMYRSCACSV